MVAVNSRVHSGDLDALWDPRWATMYAYKFFGGILLSAYIRDVSARLHFLNVYALYNDRVWMIVISSKLGILFWKVISMLFWLEMNVGVSSVEQTLSLTISANYLSSIIFRTLDP